ncbi:MAG: hypothetical protein CL608_12335 [Anaerolineaceae bacterium]|nr:hypothetical protein [Anaerolineaceae bacterium]
MTAQINDIFLYKEKEYAVAGISEGNLFDPAMLNLEPRAASTNCWRGYQAIFAVSESQLLLANLRINLFEGFQDYQRKQGPPINDCAPAASSTKNDEFIERLFNNHYEGINYPLDYSGGLLIADGFLSELYVHMGFHPAWKYTEVIEIIFENGVLEKITDRSQKMQEIRSKFAEFRSKERPSGKFEMPSEGQIREFVERAFDRSYKI